MPDQVYREFPFLFRSKGIQARPADDTLDPESYLNLDNLEELAENSFSQRLGSTLLNKSGTVPKPLPGLVHSIFKLGGLAGQTWRYGGAGTGLFRQTGPGPAAYSQISSTMSGQPWMAAIYRPDLSSAPTMFIADAAGMIKDNGSYATPQQNGIFQPQYPAIAQAQAPDEIILDNYTGTTADYTLTGVVTPSILNYFSTPLTSAAAIGVNAVSVANPAMLFPFQLVTIGAETVIVLQVTSTGFIAEFTATHPIGAIVTGRALQATVPASTTATVAKSFGGTPISAWPTTLAQADYIGILMQISDPTQINSVTIKFDCGDGSFNTDYFYKVIAQGPLQNLLNTVNQPATAATDAILSDAIGVYSNDASGIAGLNSGLNSWTPFLFQLSDFAGSGRADFSDPVFNWQNVNGYQITIVTNDQTSVTITVASLLLFGGAGPDSLGGVAYDYRWTFYNANDGTESNGSAEMTNVNYPSNTNWVTPRRQPIQVSMTLTAFGPGNINYVDTQITHARLYRKGGTLGDNWRRVDTIPINIGLGGTINYLDTSSDADIQGSDFLSLVNDVPVTSDLTDPVNTTLINAISTTNQVVSVTPVSMANISVRQLVTLGTPTAIQNNFETVIVQEVFGDHFTAFVQNTHLANEPVMAVAQIGLPVTIIAEAYGQMWYAGDKNNPHFLYWSTKNNPQAVGAANNIEVGTPDDPITCVIKIKGNLFVSTRKFWWAIAPGTNANGSPTVYPTAAKFGCVAPHGFILTEAGVYYQAIDGIRFFAGGESTYLTQDVEFIWQGIGQTPIVEADQTQLSSTVGAYWNNMLFFSYIGVDGNRHRQIAHTQYKRWRNDDADAQCIFLEDDVNYLTYGDSFGSIHLDRQNLGYDEQPSVDGLSIIHSPIAIDLQSGYQNQGMPDIQKNYNELTIDANTNGETLTATLLFDDGETTEVIGTFSSTEREKINFTLNAGDGFDFYKCSLQITGSCTARVYLWQCSIRAIPLAKTRKSFDTYWLSQGSTDCKFARDSFYEYTSTAPITVRVSYDGANAPRFTFTLPSTGGIRQSMRQRLPAVLYRMIRIVGTSDEDFQLWEETCIWFKVVCVGRGYEKTMLVPN